MEHRYTNRKPLEIGVLVSCPRVGVIRGQTIDVSAGGMFVGSECVTVPRNSPVTVSFQPDQDQPLVCFRARAMVIHQDEHGFGLMFDELGAECRHALSELLAATDSRGSLGSPVGKAIVA